MHPQIRQIGPGFCPICGLWSRRRHGETGPSAELVDMTRRFWIGLALSVPVVALEMGGHLTGLSHYVSQTTSNWIQMVLATPIVLWGGWPFFVRGWNSLVTRNLNMFTLIAMGTGVAWVYSDDRDPCARNFSCCVPHERWCCRRLFRSGSRHYVLVLSAKCSNCVRANHERRNPGAARSRTKDGAPHPQ